MPLMLKAKRERSANASYVKQDSFRAFVYLLAVTEVTTVVVGLLVAVWVIVEVGAGIFKQLQAVEI